MAIEHLKSTPISNADAVPRIPNNPYVAGGLVRTAAGKAALTAAADVGSTYRLVRVPSSARITSIKRTNGASGATGQVDVGVYKTAADGGAVVDADIFENEAVLETAGVEVELGPAAAGDKEKRLWELLGLSADPGIDYDVALTVSEVMASGIDAALEVQWVE